LLAHDPSAPLEASTRQYVDGVASTLEGSFLPITGGTVTGSVTIGADKPNCINIMGGAAGQPAQITTTGPWADITINPALNGTFHQLMWHQFPSASNAAILAKWDYIMQGTTPAGQSNMAEMHSVNSDVVDATATSGLSYFNFAGGPGAGAKGGRTGFGMSFIQAAATTMTSGQFYVAGAFWATASYPSGTGSLFAKNDSVLLKTGATGWEEVCGYELNIGVQTGASCNYKHGMTIVTWDTDAVTGSGGKDAAFSIAAAAASPVGWNYGFAFNTASGYWPMKSTGTMIGTVVGSGGGPAYQAAWGIDFSQVAFSGGLIRGPGFSVSGTGQTTTNGVVSNGGIDLGAVDASSGTDLTRHIALRTGQSGFNVQGGTLNHVAQGGHNYYVGGSFMGQIGANGLNYCQIGQAAGGESNGAFVKIAVGSATGPTWTTGSAAPAATAPVGSIYSRVGGAVGATLYVSRGAGAWNPVAGV
jgi:hypothetical protein